jgi:PhzF family phenazine biosynthesis protein
MCLQSASELNRETAFVVPASTSDPSTFHLTWFTPEREEEICGHATLATAHVLSTRPATSHVRSYTFNTRSVGTLVAEVTEDGQLQLDFPADEVSAVHEEDRVKIEKAAVLAVRGRGRVRDVHRGRFDLVIELTMHDGANLADMDVDPNALVSGTLI